MPSTLKAQILTIYWCCKLGHSTIWVSWRVTDTAIKPMSRICFTTLNDRVGSGHPVKSCRVGSQVKNHDPVPYLAWYVTSHSANSASYSQRDGKRVIAKGRWHCSVAEKVTVWRRKCYASQSLWYIHLNGLKNRDEHSACTAKGAWHSLPLSYVDNIKVAHQIFRYHSTKQVSKILHVHFW